MFTGIIEEMGTVEALVKSQKAFRLTIAAKIVLEDLEIGASVAINGACMTALDLRGKSFSCDVSPETARLTNLGALQPGDRVNLERAMRLSDRLSGHLVTGHIEGMGKIYEKRAEENAVILSITIPSSLLRCCIPKGSIGLDGVSMTINHLDEQGLKVSVIPHTVAETTLGIKEVGAVLNLESDLIGRYVERLLPYGEGLLHPPIRDRPLEAL